MICKPYYFNTKDGKEVTIRIIQENEIDEYHAFKYKAASETPYLGRSVDDYKTRKRNDTATYVAEANKDKNAYLFAVIADGKIIGDCYISFTNRIKEKHDSKIGLSILKKY